MKIKKALPLILSLFMVGGVFAGVAGCNNGSNKGNGGDGGDKEDVGGSGGGGGEVTGDTSVALPAGKKIYVVGDSTGCDYAAKGAHEDVTKNTYYVVRYGYGTQLHEYLNVKSEQVVNLALSGRSSLSFLTEENYTTLKNSIGAGDYLIIGFGHNDQKTDMSYYTNPNLTTTDATTTNGTSFKYNLYENYIKLAEEKGATPILCTPIVRYNADSAKYENSANGHITEDKTVGSTTYKGGNYSQAIRDLASEKGVALVDLTNITKQIYTDQGEGALQYHAYYTYKLDTDGTTKLPDNPDTTHLNELGAKMVAYQFAQALKNTDCALKAQVKSTATAPTYEKDFKDRTNASYVKPTASAFDPANASTIWTGVTEAGWYGTVFGDVGGANKISKENFTVTGSNGTFVIQSAGNGKFAGSTEGMAAIFKPMEASEDFTAEVTATVSGASSANNQTSFGLMLRDDIFIDKYDKTIRSNYVSAGILDGKAVFGMKDEARVAAKGAMALSETTYTLKIVKSGTSITATVTQGSNTVTETFTEISLTASDSGNIYLCMYAVRNITVTFTNVTIS